MANPFLGEIRLFGGNFAPKGWALCDGQILAISSNTALFSILGTQYGGNGTSTFALPDMRGRVPIHQGQGHGLSPYSVGQNGGTENVTLLLTEMPAHGHAVLAVGNNANSDQPSGNLLAKAATQMYSNAVANAIMSPNMIGPTGGNQPHQNIQPFVAITFIIALEGRFPTRN